MGRLTADPILKIVRKKDGKDTSVVDFSIAINERYKKENGEYTDEVTYASCVAWDSGAERIAKWFQKGSAIIVFAKYINDDYINADGKKVKNDRFRVSNFQFPLVEKVHDKNGTE